MICVDANVATKWVLTEPDSALALDLYAAAQQRGNVVVAPAFMPIEVTNAIWRRVVDGLISLAEAEERLATFVTYKFALATPAGLHQAALDLTHGFSRPNVYDMHYVALAQIAGCDLWTADRRLLNAIGGRLPFVRNLADLRL